MNEINYNQKFRKIIVNDINTIIDNFLYSLDDAIGLYIENLYCNLIDTNSFYKLYLETLIYTDAYKMYNYKHKKLASNPIDILDYNDIFSIEDYNDLTSSISADPHLFALMIKSTYEFYHTSGLTKVIILKSLGLNDNIKLNKVAPIHEQDQKKYNRTISFNDLIKSYQNLSKFYNEDLEIDFNEGIINTISSFIKELYLIDKDNAKKLIKRFIIIDKIILTHLKEHHNLETNQRLNIYNQNYDKLCYLLINNTYILDNIIKDVIESITNNKYNSIDLDNEIANKIMILKRN